MNVGRAKRKAQSWRSDDRVRLPPAPYIVFLSHSGTDGWVAKVLGEKIEALGATAWLDEKDLEGGDIVVGEILSGIDACQEVVVLISPSTVTSQWVAFEVGAARMQRKRVTPVLNGVKHDALKPMADAKAIDINRLDRFLAQLALRIRETRSRKPR